MTSVQYLFPKLKLTQQLKAPGGLPVAEALEAAHANLAELQPQCVGELRTRVGEAVACFQRFPAEFDADLLAELYAIAARAVGLGGVGGIPAADAALVSLCDLLDRLGVRVCWDLEAVAVHVQTLQLLALGEAQADAAATEKLLSGLRKISARYASTPDASSGEDAAALPA